MNLIKKYVEDCWESCGYAVLLFHGVTEIEEMGCRNSNKKHLHALEFKKILTFLQSVDANFMLMSDLERAINSGKPLNKVACITFDDGFRNNLHTAIPILKDFDATATIYVTTDFIELNLMSWIDRVEYAVEKTNLKLLEIDNHQFPLNSIEEKIQCLKDIRKIFKQNKIEKNFLASEIQNKLINKEVYSNESDLDQKLNWSEVKQIENMENFEIGAHTISHPSLSHLEVDDQYSEIYESLKIISQKTGSKINLFAYPEGTQNDFNQITIQVLKELGIKSSPSAVPFNIKGVDELYSIPRLNCDHEIL